MSGTTRGSFSGSARPRRRGGEFAEEELFGREFLTPRPLLQAIEHQGPMPAVLLVDELDRADDDFEAFLFEMLAESSVTIPEIGTIRATHPPAVILTSNRTRDLHDALKRRCLYHWIDYPEPGARGRNRPPPRAGDGGGARDRGGRGGPPPALRAMFRSRRGSPRRSTGSPPWSCSGSIISTPRRRSGPWARC